MTEGHLTERVIPDLDIYRSAQVLVKRHGQDAPIHAALRAVEELRRAEPGRNERTH